jgi:MFS family permease
MTRSERSYYLLFGSYNLAQFFIAPIYPLFLLSRGLDLFQINAVLATYGVTVVLFEVPTGAIADVAGRRLAFVLGCAIRAAAYLLYTRVNDFQDCVFAEFLDAIGTTFVSGALDAWAVDGVRGEGDHRPMDGMFSRAAVVARSLMIAGGLAGGYLAEVWLILPWLVAGALFALSGVAGAVLMGETRAPPASETDRPSVRRTMREGISIVRTSPVLLLLCALALVSAFAAFPIHMLWQPRVVALGGDRLRIMGWIVALLNVTSLAGSALLPRLLRRFRRESILCAAMLWRSAMVAVLAAASTFRPAVAGLLLQEVAFGLSDPVTAAWTNEHVAAAQRATVLSVRSTVVLFGASIGLLTIGLVARSSGMPAAFAVSAALFALAAPGFLVLGRVANRRAAAGVAPLGVAAPLPTKAG